jgi:hypothetical protein
MTSGSFKMDSGTLSRSLSLQTSYSTFKTGSWYPPQATALNNKSRLPFDRSRHSLEGTAARATGHGTPWKGQQQEPQVTALLGRDSSKSHRSRHSLEGTAARAFTKNQDCNKSLLRPQATGYSTLG